MDYTYFSKIINRIDEHSRYRNECLNLIASENVLSFYARMALSTDIGGRYTVGQPHRRFFPGLKYYDDIELIAQKLAKLLFHAPYVNVQPTSGMVANMTAYYALLKENDVILSLKEEHGGHFSHSQEGVLKLFKVKVENLPFDVENYSVDIERTIHVIKKIRPAVIILGSSEFLFPIPLLKLKKICNHTNTKILYDASHVAGLIAGGTFQNPLEEGADILTASTNKTLAGPNHGLIAYNDADLFRKKIEEAILPVFTSHHHPHHIAALAITLAETEVFGYEYAMQLVKNAQHLGFYLENTGISVLCPHRKYTQSHTILLHVPSNATHIVRLLEKAHIMTSSCKLPWDKPNGISGIRIGLSELTRLGMKECHMEEVARLISSAILKSKSARQVRKEVIEFKLLFQQPAFCFPKMGKLNRLFH